MNAYKSIIVTPAGRKLVALQASDWRTAETIVRQRADRTYGPDNWTFEVEPLIIRRAR